MGKCGETLPSTYSFHNHYGNLRTCKCYRINNSMEWMKPQFDIMLRMPYETSHPTVFSEREKKG